MEYERLTRRDEDGNAVPAHASEFYLEADKEVLDALAEVFEGLSDLEDEIENGTLVRLHCKVGDTVFVPWVWNEESGVATLEVEHIDIQRDNECRIYLDVETDDIEFEMEYRVHLMSNLGKTWFTDKKQAEAKLKELQGETE